MNASQFTLNRSTSILEPVNFRKSQLMFPPIFRLGRTPRDRPRVHVALQHLRQHAHRRTGDGASGVVAEAGRRARAANDGGQPAQSNVRPSSSAFLNVCSRSGIRVRGRMRVRVRETSTAIDSPLERFGALFQREATDLIRTVCPCLCL